MKVIITPDHITLSKPKPIVNQEDRMTAAEWQVLHETLEQSYMDHSVIQRKLWELEKEDNALTALQELDNLDNMEVT